MEANPAGPDVVKQEIIASEMDPEIPKIYFNGLSIQCRGGDVALLLKREENISLGVLYMSHDMARTISEAIKNVLDQHEKKTGRKFLSLFPMEEGHSP